MRKVASMVKSFLRKDTKVKHDLTKLDKPTKVFKFKNLVKPRFSLVVGIKKPLNIIKKF